MNAFFDLIDEPWIPCLDMEGKRVELGLRDTLARAHELADLQDESPLTTAALLRLLQAVLYAALDGPADDKAWCALWKAGAFSATKLDRYFKAWRPRFDLFDEKHPFFQVGGFEITGKEGSPVTKLTHQLATGNAATLFDHTIEEREVSVTPAVAARWLVTCQSFAVGGGQGATSNAFGKHPYFADAPMVGGVAVYLRGRTLFESLALNLVPLSSAGLLPGKGDDRPTWEADRVQKPGKRLPRGMMEFLSWRSRMVRLIPEDRSGSTAVAKMHFASGWSLADDVMNPAWAYTLDNKDGRAPVGLRQGRSLWRDSSALLANVQLADGQRSRCPAALAFANHLVEREVLPPGTLLNVICFGLANDKAKVLLWRREGWEVPARLLREPESAARLVAALGDADAAGKAVYAALSLASEAFWDCLTEVRNRGMLSYWSALDGPFRALLVDLPAQPERALTAWRAHLVRSARGAVREATDNIQRRSSRELQARVEAEGLLAWKLQQFTKTEETSDGNA